MTDEEFRDAWLHEEIKQTQHLKRIADALERVSPPSKIVGTPRQSDIGDLIAPTLKELAEAEQKDRQEDRDGVWRDPEKTPRPTPGLRFDL